VNHPSKSSAIGTELVERIRAGEVRALEALFRQEYEPLCRFAERYLGDRAASEDLVQDLFLALWARRGRIELRVGLRAYLFASVRNRALNVRKHQLLERDWERDEGAPEVRMLHRAPHRPDELLEERERDACLRAAIARLPERRRLVMQLRWQEQLGYAEIAAILGISVKGVEIQLARGLRALRAHLRRDTR
jgi:RNA polymerase sigma-70 factor (ECF subfamily)